MHHNPRFWVVSLLISQDIEKVMTLVVASWVKPLQVESLVPRILTFPHQKKPSGSSGSCQTVRSGVCVVMKAGPFSQLLRSWTTKELMKDVLPDIPKMAKNAQENITTLASKFGYVGD